MAEKKVLHKSNFFLQVSFYSLYGLLFIIPLIFSSYFHSGFDLVKNSSLIIIGGLFIILYSVYLITGIPGKNKNSYGIFADKKIDIPVCIFILAVLASTMFSVNPEISFFGSYVRQEGFMTYLYLGVIYFFASGILRDEDRFNKVLTAMKAAAVLTALYAIIQTLKLDPFGIHIIKEGVISSRPVTSFGHPNFAAGMMLLVLPFTLAELNKNNFFAVRMLIPVLLAAGIFVTQS